MARNLKPGQKLVKCPKCLYSSSIVYPATIKELKSPKTRKFTRSRTCQQIDKPMLGAATKNWKSVNDVPINVSEFAECTRGACGYRFCTKCLLKQHQNSKCPTKPLGSSPNSDDELSRTSRNGIRSLRRINRLAF